MIGVARSLPEAIVARMGWFEEDVSIV